MWTTQISPNEDGQTEQRHPWKLGVGRRMLQRPTKADHCRRKSGEGRYFLLGDCKVRSWRSGGGALCCCGTRKFPTQQEGVRLIKGILRGDCKRSEISRVRDWKGSY